MKKTLLALAVLTAASSVNAAEILKSDEGSVDFYGQLRTRIDFTDANDYAAELTTGSSRLGLDAAYAVNDSTKVLGKVEFGVPANDSSTLTTRVHTVGFATDFGTFKFGKDWKVSDDLGGTDYSYVYGGSANAYATIGGAADSSQLKYSLDLENFWVKAGYGFADGADKQDLAEAFAGTSFGPVALSLGGGKNHLGDFSNVYYKVTGVFTVSDALELSATYYGSQLEQDNTTAQVDQNGISVGAWWTVMDKTSVYGGYEFKNTEATDVLNDADEDFTNIFVGVEYKFASWARVFAEANYADGSTLGYGSDDKAFVAGTTDSAYNYSLGMRVYW